MDGIDPATRLLFWLRIPFVADVVLVPFGIVLLLTGNGTGWWLLLFTALKSAINVAGLWFAKRMLARAGERGRERDGD